MRVGGGEETAEEQSPIQATSTPRSFIRAAKINFLTTTLLNSLFLTPTFKNFSTFQNSSSLLPAIKPFGSLIYHLRLAVLLYFLYVLFRTTFIYYISINN